MASSSDSAPRVSIIMRTRNRPDLLERAMADVFAQSLHELELVVVDDSDDPAPVAAVAAALPEGQQARTQIVSRAGQTHGRWPAANAGLAVARGDYVSLHDDDDYWDPHFLTDTSAFLDAHPEAAGVCTRTNIVIERPDATGTLQTTDIYPFLPELTVISTTEMLRANRIPPISMLYRRSLHDRLGSYDESLSVLGDWDFYLRVITAYPIELLDGPPMAYWSHRPESFGDAENSISAGAIRAATEARIRDRHVREGVARGGMSAFVHIANESRWLDERAEARAQSFTATTTGALDRIAERLEQLEQLEQLSQLELGRLEMLEQRLVALQSDVSLLHRELLDRTSLGNLLRRPFRRFRRRRK